jgi:hypothetical protein
MEAVQQQEEVRVAAKRFNVFFCLLAIGLLASIVMAYVTSNRF